MNGHSEDCNIPAVGPCEPDFLCVGMEKAATSWLFDQLRTHPDFWIPPIKELRYLHTATPRMDSTSKLLARLRQGRKRRLSETDIAFIYEAEVLVRQPRDIEKYAALFRVKANQISGDISPMYCVLGGEDIGSIASRFPNLKVILMVREPVERAWSHICQHHRMGHFDLALLADATEFGKWFENSKLKRASMATRALQRWSEFAPSIPFRYYFFDQVALIPDVVRAEIITFLGGDPEKRSGELPANYNHKASASKLPLPQPIESVLVEQLAEEIRASARLFGGPAESWPARHGL
jgi:hypothetical protein